MAKTVKLKKFEVTIYFERLNPKTKKKEPGERGWSPVIALSAKDAIEICTKNMWVNEGKNSPKITKSIAKEIK